MESIKRLSAAAYRRHLESDYWQRVKREIWTRDKGNCRHCHRSGRDVHHLSYEFLGHELDEGGLDTLLLLCRKCHRAAHGLDPKGDSHPDFQNPAPAL